MDTQRRSDRPASSSDKSKLFSLVEKLREIELLSPKHILAFHTLADMTLKFLHTH